MRTSTPSPARAAGNADDVAPSAPVLTKGATSEVANSTLSRPSLRIGIRARACANETRTHYWIQRKGTPGGNKGAHFAAFEINPAVTRLMATAGIMGKARHYSLRGQFFGLYQQRLVI
jgi:hypothetical protein